MLRILAFIFSFLFLSCSAKKETTVSFYYWKTIFWLSDHENQTLKENKVTKLYVRYFDVQLKKGSPVPQSPIVFTSLPPVDSIVPVVFIKNEVMLLPSLDTEDLAKKVVSYIDRVNIKHTIHSHEIQLDCDWTLKSKDKYFAFIDHVKKLSNKKLSATIRLHQVKYYRTTGIPNVDRRVLMYYNMGHVGPQVANSIYDKKTSDRYISSIKHYPAPLDVALPVFSWGIHIRNNKVIDLLSKIDTETFAQDTRFEIRPPFVEAKANAIKGGNYFQHGDKIKIECVTSRDLKEMAEDLSEQLAHKPHAVIFYDLDEFNLKHYNDEESVFQKISGSF